MAESEETLGENTIKIDEEIEVDLAKCVAEFAQYCQVDVRNESKAIEDTIEDMLVRLDEFSHLADTIRNDSSQSLIEIMPQLHLRSQELPTIFRKIDQLEAFVNAVKKNVDQVEESVATAERELGSHTIQKVLNSIPGLRQMKPSPTKKEKNLAEWQAPAIFKTSDFFGVSAVDDTCKDDAEDASPCTNNLPDEEATESVAPLTDS